MGRKSAEDVEAIVNKHIRPYFGDRIAATLGTRDFEQYRIDKKNEADPLEDTTLNRHMSYLRSYYHTGFSRITPRMVDFTPVFPMTDESGNVRQGFLTSTDTKSVEEDHMGSSGP